jgi:exopolyphosphatase/guanosine-5'-triphosphate,3'-diphosphate pyrophosphatase
VRLATVDVGTNTTLLLVAEATDARDIRILADRAEVTRLGRGIGVDGRLRPEGIASTLDVLEQYAAAARTHGADVVAVGTEALRRAPNAADFLKPAAMILDAPVEVIEGQREAGLTFLAAVASFPDVAASPLAVVDIGGGSTEVIVSQEGLVRSRVSLPLGSVRLTERHLHSDPPLPREIAALTAEVEQVLQAVSPRGIDGEALALIGTAGTVTTLCAMSLQLPRYDPGRVHGHPLGRADLEAQVARLTGSSQEARERMVGLDPRRADVILAGAYILLGLARRFEAESVLVNDRGIRWGLLYEKLAGG